MLTNEQLLKIEQDAQKATHGPWEVHTRVINHYKGGSYPTQTIRTQWIQGQLKDKMPVIATATGLGESPDTPSHTVWMTVEDASHIANCDPQTVMELVKMARRYLAVQTHFLVRDDENTTYFDDPAYFQTDEDLDRAVDKFINSQHKEGGGG